MSRNVVDLVVPPFQFSRDFVQKHAKLQLRGYVPPMPVSWMESNAYIFYGGWSAKTILDALGWPVHYWLSKEQKPQTSFCDVREPVGQLDGELAMEYPTFSGYHKIRFPEKAAHSPGRPAPLPLLVLALAMYKHLHNADFLPSDRWFRALAPSLRQVTIRSSEEGIVLEARDRQDQNTSPPTAMIE